MMPSAQEMAEQIGAFRREVAGKIRRMTIGAVPGSIWQMLGHVLFDVTSRESSEVEVFSGIGFFSRPPDGNGEAVVVEIGGANGPVVVATRDEATRALVDDIAADETAAFNTEVRLYLKADGTIEARTHGGAALALPTLATVAKIATAIAGANSATAATLQATILATLATSLHGAAGTVPWPVGTAVLKAE